METYKQRRQYDCHLCCIAMAAQRPPEEIFSEAIYEQIEKDKSSNRHDSTELKKLFALAGFEEDRDYWTVYVGSQNAKRNVLNLLQGRRALIQVTSLNAPPPAQHIVFWDGQALHDPSTNQVYQWLEQLISVEHVTIFNEQVPAPAEISQEQMTNMVNRFLGWKLPLTFGPDCFIRFDREKAKANQSWPSGTNLFCVAEAREMLAHMLTEIRG